MKNVSPLHTKGAKQVHFLNFQLICEAKYINRFTQKMEANCSDEAHKRVIYLLAENIIYISRKISLTQTVQQNVLKQTRTAVQQPMLAVEASIFCNYLIYIDFVWIFVAALLIVCTWVGFRALIRLIFILLRKFCLHRNDEISSLVHVKQLQNLFSIFLAVRFLFYININALKQRAVVEASNLNAQCVEYGCDETRMGSN